MYLQKSDYRGRIESSLFNVIISDVESKGEDLLQTNDKTAIDTISTYTGVLYDLSAEWAKADLQRHGMVLSWALSIALYWTYQRIDDEAIPAKVIKNYEDTLDILEKVATGKHPLNFPPRAIDGKGLGSGAEGPVKDGTGLRRIGSRTPRTHII